MIDIKIATKDNIDELINSRLEMIKVVNNLMLQIHNASNYLVVSNEL